MLNNLYDISNTMRPGDNFTFDFSDEFVCVLSKSLKHNDTSFPINAINSYFHNHTLILDECQRLL